jgi:hypothetical protein
MAYPIRRSKVTRRPSVPPGSNPALHVRAGDRLELPALGSVLVEEPLKLPAGHLAADHALADLDDLVFIALGHRLPPLGG